MPTTNVQGFTIERAVKAKGTPVFAAVSQTTANATSYSETVSERNLSFLYRVRAFNVTTGKVSSYSNQVQLRVR
jgi:hypothetical protein